MVDVMYRNRKYNWAGSGVGGGGGCGGAVVTARLLPSRQHVHHRVLDERAEHEDQTGRHPDVDRLGERHGRHSAHVHRALRRDAADRCAFPSCTARSRCTQSALRRDRQHRQDAETDASRHRLKVDPERHPRQQHDQ